MPWPIRQRAGTERKVAYAGASDTLLTAHGALSTPFMAFQLDADDEISGWLWTLTSGGGGGSERHQVGWTSVDLRIARWDGGATQGREAAARTADGGDDDQSEAMESRLNHGSQRRDQRERPNLDG
ncbi:hypothetical protein CABS03_12155 [Colletotrichum abscissum]|uniref:Uncharacterized protein n=1 Tax=Colletotrichum abscissum TaxID=1671311 RepID=A0A9P9XIR9_9PEZI|nr:hypothetical protein CABS02_05649 [Colletotrichum abscissum]